ncbi:hypothetical protein DFQ28_004132 [Apophysomyces sp. BC1034]|nr:hypothetical protein DFQ29_003230 [Apophysomyces sp. BC1021]KAG0188952.1 hypothetical protein DFQ28_004132 [Apophysomyces sp. BC1034]
MEPASTGKDCALRLVIPSYKLGAPEYPTPENDASSPYRTARSAGLTVVRTPPIPIHDPSDDIDSDTPIYKSEEHVITDRTAVLGELSNTSSEELMNQIYSGFIEDSVDKKTNCKCTDRCTCSGNTSSKPLKPKPSKHRPTAMMGANGAMLCGCGVQKPLESCSDCFQDMCEEYLLGHQHQ